MRSTIDSASTLSAGLGEDEDVEAGDADRDTAVDEDVEAGDADRDTAVVVADRAQDVAQRPCVVTPCGEEPPEGA